METKKQLSAICLIQDVNSGYFLLLKRNNEMRQYNNLYSLAGGRFDEDCDSSLRDTVFREVKEETNITLDYKRTHHIMCGENDNWVIDCYFSHVDMDNVDFRINPDEHSSYVFVPRDEILDYLVGVPVTIDCVKKYIDEIFPSE